MRQLAKIGACLLFVCGMTALLLLPRHRYDWMQQMDPAMTVPADPVPGNAELLAGLVLLLILGGQLTLALSCKTHRARIVAAALSLTAIALWAWRFAR